MLILEGSIVLDPGSRAFDEPEACGYSLLYKDLEQYVEGLSQPSWDQWLNYETDLLDKTAILDMIAPFVGNHLERMASTSVLSAFHAEKEKGLVTGTPVGCACGDGVIDWARVLGILREANWSGVLSVECGTPEQALRSRLHLDALIGQPAAA